MKNLYKVLVIFLSGMLIAGCTETKLTPEETGNTNVVKNSAVTEVNNVIVSVQGDVWEDDEGIKDFTTPLNVHINNNSNRMLAVRYNEFALVSNKGKRYNALPPYKVEGEAANPVVTDQYMEINVPKFEEELYLIAPYYTVIYPGLATYEDPFVYDSVYYSKYYDYWEQFDADVPTLEMYNRALPDGVLKPGGKVKGDLFFEKVNEDLNQVRFRADLVDAVTGEKFGEISIPFNVMEED